MGAGDSHCCHRQGSGEDLGAPEALGTLEALGGQVDTVGETESSSQSCSQHSH